MYHLLLINGKMKFYFGSCCFSIDIVNYSGRGHEVLLHFPRFCKNNNPLIFSVDLVIARHEKPQVNGR